MKLLLDIDDDKALHLLEVLKGLSYVRTEPLSEEKVMLIHDLKAAVSELKYIRGGKKSANSAQSFINELWNINPFGIWTSGEKASQEVSLPKNWPGSIDKRIKRASQNRHINRGKLLQNPFGD